MGSRVRGAKDIKRLSSLRARGIHANDRHVHQFQIACLELERTRRIQERHAAAQRIDDVDARITEIDALIRQHHRVLGVHADSERGSGAHPASAEPPARRVLRY